MWTARPRFIPEDAFRQLLANGHCTAGNCSIDPPPVVKLFTPDANATWLLTEIDPEDEDRAFGLCDLGLGSPELGWVRLSQLAEVRGRYGLFVERDVHFVTEQPLSIFASQARAAGRITA